MLTYQRTEGRDPRTVAAGGSQAAEGRSPSGSSLNCQWSLHAAAARPLSAHPTKETQTDHSAAAFSHFRSVPKPAPSPACGRSSAPTPSAPWRPHFARLRVGAGPASPRKRRFPARGARQLRPALPRRENHISHNPMGCPLRLRGPACAATRPGPPRQAEVEPLDCGRDVLQATEMEFVERRKRSALLAPAGAGGGGPGAAELAGPGLPSPPPPPLRPRVKVTHRRWRPGPGSRSRSADTRSAEPGAAPSPGFGGLLSTRPDKWRPASNAG